MTLSKINELLLYGTYISILTTFPFILLMRRRNEEPTRFGSAHFSKANDYLVNLGQVPIDWQID